MHPLVREVEFHTVDISNSYILLLAIQLLHLDEDSIYIGRSGQVDAVLGDEVVREAGTKLAYLATLMSQTAQEESNTYESVTTIVALWIESSIQRATMVVMPW